MFVQTLLHIMDLLKLCENHLPSKSTKLGTVCARRNGSILLLPHNLLLENLRHAHSPQQSFSAIVDLISHLPKELALYIYSFLDCKSLLRASGTCRAWRDLANDDILWRDINRVNAVVDERFLFEPHGSEDGFQHSSWKLNYVRHRRIYTNWKYGATVPLKHLHAHEGYMITCLLFTDDDRLISGSDDGSLKVWSIHTGLCQYTLKGHGSGVWAAEAEGSLLVSGSRDRTICVWNLDTGDLDTTLYGHAGTIRCLALKDGVCVSGSRDFTLRVWKVKLHAIGDVSQQTSACVGVLIGHAAAVKCVRYNGDYIVSGSYDHEIRVWNPRAGVCVHILTGHTERVYTLLFVKVGSAGALSRGAVIQLLESLWDQVSCKHFRYLRKLLSVPQLIKCWLIQTIPVVALVACCDHFGVDAATADHLFQFDGIHIISGSLDTTIRVWDVKSGALNQVLHGHNSLISGLHLYGNILVSGNADATVRMWDINTGTCLRTLGSDGCMHESAVTSVHVDQNFVVTSSDDGTCKLWDVDTGRFVRDIVKLSSRDNGGVVWRVLANRTKLVCAVGSRALTAVNYQVTNTEKTKLLLFDFDTSIPL